MKRLFSIAIIAVTAISCSHNQPKVTYLKGELANADDSIVRITNREITDTVLLDTQGYFSYQLELTEPVYLTVRVGRPTFTVFLTPGQTLTLQHDFSNNVDEVQFEGELAPQNQYIAKANRNWRSAIADFNTLFTLEPEAFNARLDSVLASLQDSLHQVLPKNNDFNRLEALRMDFHFKNLRLQYPIYLSYLTGTTLPADSFANVVMEKVDLSNEQLVSIPQYGELLSDYLSIISSLENQKTQGLSMFETRVKYFDLVDSLVSSSLIRDLLKYKSILVTLQIERLEEAQSAAELFLSNAKDEKYLAQISYALSKRMLLAPGKEAPEFSLGGIDGATYSLADLRGSLVYIDFWATWCGPCLAEIPHLTKLKSDYAGKPIKFVAISLDDNREDWIKMVNERNLSGIQLHAEKAWSSGVANQYQIKGIPTFVLIDGNGLIIEYQAPRPSESDIRLLIDKHLKKL